MATNASAGEKRPTRRPVPEGRNLWVIHPAACRGVVNCAQATYECAETEGKIAEVFAWVDDRMKKSMICGCDVSLAGGEVVLTYAEPRKVSSAPQIAISRMRLAGHHKPLSCDGTYHQARSTIPCLL